MPTVHLMAGIPGSGKSFFAKKLAASEQAVYISSDEIRENWYGDASVQGDNSRLFEDIRRRIRNYLAGGMDVVFDATNLSRRKRIHFTRNDVRGFPVVAHVLCTPFSACLARNQQRERKVDEQILERMYKQFELPFSEEGFCRVAYYAPDLSFDPVLKQDIKRIMGEAFSYQDFFQVLNHLPGFPEIYELSHDSKLHHLSVSRHSYFIHQEVVEQYHGPDKEKLLWLSMLHDIGKGFCKSFLNFKGAKQKYARFDGHENVSAYLAVQLLKNLEYSHEFIHSTAKLISLHMLEAETSKKRRKNANKLLHPEEKQVLDHFAILTRQLR
ncbi:AAA family ATPase [Sediminibacillus halophilus]|uniref:Predicted kinase n=1 Tax=Sediminibacillus halophilus TaxID=482461 RepID=A0A1G9WTQ8_9BACI|nr:AAA family ATPase [Sediminibacillus halophilus]SDM87651.1 Predicted kinase [Sediminibacillus halophilus]